MTNSLLQATPLRAGIIAAGLVLVLTGGPARADDVDPVVAKVNGTEIHQSDLAVAEEEAGQLPPMSPNAKKDYLVQFVTDMILMSQAAEAKKMGDTLEFKRKLAFNREKLLMEQLLQKAGKEALTDKAMHDVYDEAAKQMGQEQEVHARHILIRAAAGDDKASKEAEDKIKAIIVRLKKARISPRWRPKLPKIPPARPMAAISAISARSRWYQNSPTPPSSWTRARSPSR